MPPSKKLWVAYLLLIPSIFGVAGLHRIYLGKKWTGYVYLLTFGLAGIGVLYDALFMNALVREANTRDMPFAYEPPRVIYMQPSFIVENHTHNYPSPPPPRVKCGYCNAVAYGKKCNNCGASLFS